jgi:hypothetical protein
MAAIINQLKQIHKKVEALKSTSEREFLTNKYTPPIGTKMVICSLWKNTYRLNFWGKKTIDPQKGQEDSILSSVFVKLQRKDDSFIVLEEYFN